MVKFRWQPSRTRATAEDKGLRFLGVHVTKQYICTYYLIGMHIWKHIPVEASGY